jgi:predicted RNA methylase
VIGFDIDPESLETATLNAEELEVFLKFFVFYVNEFSFGCIANTIAIIGLFCRSR